MQDAPRLDVMPWLSFQQGCAEVFHVFLDALAAEVTGLSVPDHLKHVFVEIDCAPFATDL
jgi:hypothetical protein